MNTNSKKKSTPVEFLETDSKIGDQAPTHRFVHQKIETLLQELYDQGKNGLREVDIVNAQLSEHLHDFLSLIVGCAGCFKVYREACNGLCLYSTAE